jgi:hypothetical protein
LSTCIFLGPTLPRPEAEAVLQATYLPPARQGDVYRAVRDHRPGAIGIIDGYFHQVPSVWHKEILWAMTEGVHVFGSASMGALRAAELEAFGMEGVGRVFEAFQRGLLEDDDEVAVVHAPAELGFLAASEAMVNIRWTVDAAKREGVVRTETAEHLIRIAKALFYPKRSFQALLKQAFDAKLADDELGAFATWLPRGRIDIKQQDALAMLRHIGEHLGDVAPEKSVDYRFEHTSMWEMLRHDAQNVESTVDRSLDVLLMDELRLNEAHDAIREKALLRLLALDEADRQGLRIDAQAQQRAHVTFRAERSLQRAPDLQDWLQAHDLRRGDLDRLLDQTLRGEDLARRLQVGLADFAMDQLRLEGGYQEVIKHVRAKRLALSAAESDPELTDSPRALTWYFERRKMALPEDLDAYAHERDFRDAADFKRAVSQDFFCWRIFNEAASEQH